MFFGKYLKIFENGCCKISNTILFCNMQYSKCKLSIYCFIWNTFPDYFAHLCEEIASEDFGCFAYWYWNQNEINPCWSENRWYAGILRWADMLTQVRALSFCIGTTMSASCTDEHQAECLAETSGWRPGIRQTGVVKRDRLSGVDNRGRAIEVVVRGQHWTAHIADQFSWPTTCSLRCQLAGLSDSCCRTMSFLIPLAEI